MKKKYLFTKLLESSQPRLPEHRPSFLQRTLRRRPFGLLRIGSPLHIHPPRPVSDKKLMLADLDRNQWLSADELRQLQWKRLKNLLNHAYQNSIFYRNRFEEVGIHPQDIHDIDDLRKIPILTKKDLQQNLESLRAYDHSRLLQDASGGSTGNPVQFYKDHSAKLWMSQAHKRFQSWVGYSSKDRLALIWGADRDIPLSQRSKQRWLNSFNWTNEQIESFIEELVEWGPAAIRCYASSMFIVASYIKKHKQQAPRLKGIESSAEKLWDYQRDLIEEVFQCKVFEKYGSREISQIAGECEFHSGLHIFSDICLIEIIRDGLPTSPTEEGSIIVTDLLNYGMPFIRYEIGDVGIISDKICPCGRGFPLLEEIKGRVTSTIQTPDGRYIHGEYFTHLFYKMSGVKAFQVRQRSLYEVEVAIQPDTDFDSSKMESLVSEIRSHLGDQVSVKWETVSAIPSAPSGKYHYTISDVPIDYITE